MMSLQERQFIAPDWFWDHPVFSDDVFVPADSQARDGRIATVPVDMDKKEDIYVIGQNLLQELEEQGIPTSLPSYFTETFMEGRKVYYVPGSVLDQQPALSHWTAGWSWVLFDRYLQNYGKLHRKRQLEDVLIWLLSEMGEYARSQLGFPGYGSRQVLESFVSSLKLYSFGTQEEKALRLPATLMPNEQIREILQQHNWGP